MKANVAVAIRNSSEDSPSIITFSGEVRKEGLILKIDSPVFGVNIFSGPLRFFEDEKKCGDDD